MKKQIILILAILCLILIGCSARIDGSLSANGSATLSINMSLERGITALVQRMFTAGGQAGPILDGSAIAKSMSDSPGVISASFRNTSPSAIEGQVRLSQVKDFGFVSIEQGASGGRCIININGENSQEVLELLSPDITNYLNALMAPVATGEEMTKREYLDIVTSFYNKTISDEIASSRVRVSIEFPGVVTAVKGGTFSGRRANFDIPLLDILVLEAPLIYEVSWN